MRLSQSIIKLDIRKRHRINSTGAGDPQEIFSGRKDSHYPGRMWRDSTLAKLSLQNHVFTPTLAGSAREKAC